MGPENIAKQLTKYRKRQTKWYNRDKTRKRRLARKEKKKIEVFHTDQYLADAHSVLPE